jgi:cell division protein FtsA
MSQDRIIAAIDGGATKVCTTVTRVAQDGTLTLMGYGLVKSQGFRKGAVVDLEQAQDALRESVEDAARSSGVRITGAYLGITGAQMKSVVARGETPLTGKGVVTRDDVLRAQRTGEARLNGSAGDIIHTIPLEYSVDGRVTQDALDSLRGVRLGVATHYVASPPNAVWNLKKAAQAAGLEVHGLVAQSIASGEAVLTEEEMHRGVVVMDIGGGTTDIAIFYEGKPVYTAVLPVGGWQLTNDIAMGLDTPATTAEEVKLQHGCIYPQKGEPFTIPTVGKLRQRVITDVQLSALIKERMGEVLRYTLLALDGAPRRYPLPCGIVFTGGSSQVSGLGGLAEDILGVRSRVGRPSGIKFLPEELSGPAFATSAGIHWWVVREGQRRAEMMGGVSGDGTLPGRVRGWLKTVFQVA